MHSRHTSLSERARGRWAGILPEFGIDRRYLSGKHGPCPMCGGKDRFRWDNKDGRGSFFCSVCGAGDGVALVMKTTGLPFKEAAAKIEGVLGNAPIVEAKAGASDAEKRAANNRLWLSSAPVAAGDPVALWLGGRAGVSAFPRDLRTARHCRYEDGSHHPAMIAMVRDRKGEPVTLHRTFLTKDGRKAAVEKCRMLMPGTLTKGAAVRIMEYGPVLGIAEGIETAFAAHRLFNVPVWAALNSGMLSHWEPPEGVREVIVFADNDPKFGGQAAAYSLAHRLAAQRGVLANVETPESIGDDWNDVLLRQGVMEAAE